MPSRPVLLASLSVRPPRVQPAFATGTATGSRTHRGFAVKTPCCGPEETPCRPQRPATAPAPTPGERPTRADLAMVAFLGNKAEGDEE